MKDYQKTSTIVGEMGGTLGLAKNTVTLKLPGYPGKGFEFQGSSPDDAAKKADEFVRANHGNYYNNAITQIRRKADAIR